jgi:hypothetical protein
MRSPALPCPLFIAAVVAGALLAPSAHADPPVAVAAAGAPLAVPVPVPVAAPSLAEEDARRLRFTAGISLTGLGALTMVLGGVLGARALVSKNDIGAHCSTAGKCDLVGYTYLAEAQDFSSTSTACFILGPLAAAVGVGLLISSTPKKTGVSAWIAPTPRGLAGGGSF